jgi:hypothetical protein
MALFGAPIAQQGEGIGAALRRYALARIDDRLAQLPRGEDSAVHLGTYVVGGLDPAPAVTAPSPLTVWVKIAIPGTSRVPGGRRCRI